MPGRQSHGRPLLPKSRADKPNKSNKQKAKGSAARALEAFSIAAEQEPSSRKGVRSRDLDVDSGERTQKRRHQGDEGGDEDDEGDDDEEVAAGGPRNKRAKKNDDEFEGLSGSDSEGNDWHEGMNAEDDDSEIDSDEAFGESDEERFEGFTFRGSSSRKDDEDEEDLESLGSDAIDLAQALDQASSDEDEEGEEGSAASGSDSGSESDDESSMESVSDDDDDEDPAKLDALQGIISGFAGGEDEEATEKPRKAKISLKDLGISGLKDPNMKKSVKLMTKEEKSKPGSAKKLDVPLARRQQDKLLRAVAYDKANETLGRWTDTVKHNRRAEHLIFPLPQDSAGAVVDGGEIQPMEAKAAGTELEQTILSIMEESGLGPSSKPKKATKEDADGEEAPTISRAELKEAWSQRRRDRELHSREQARAKRIKKIKSKAYHRVHRKERLRDEEIAHEALAEAGEIDSDDEREAQHRRRAEERMGARHRESKWAKKASKVGRAVWDEDFRSGLTDMARKDAELRRRVEGRTGDTDDEDGDDNDQDGSDESDGDDESARRSLLQQLNEVEMDDTEAPTTGLMSLKFMQRAEAERKKANDELVAEIRRGLASDDEEESEQEQTEIGRRQYGVPIPTKSIKPGLSFGTQKASQEEADGTLSTSKAASKQKLSRPLSLSAEQSLLPATQESGGAWSQVGKERRKDKKSKGTNMETLDLSAALAMATTQVPKARETRNKAVEADSSEDEDALHLPMAIRDQELIKRAFAGDEVVGEFEKDKTEIAEEDDDKIIDNTLPGWGSWVGEGISNREKKRHQGRFLTKVEGIKKKDRKDAKLEKVIISERRAKKNDKYLASQLPHPFESREQYERSLRLPIGPEWMTKETFQESTKPRIILKQGIIAPISRPVA